MASEEIQGTSVEHKFTMEELAEKQLVLGNEIQRIISNYKKDSPSRKTELKYYEERLAKLNDTSARFKETDAEIRKLENISADHEYFKRKYYDEVKALFEQYIKHFKDKINILNSGTVNAANNYTASEDQTKIMRRQRALIKSLERLLASKDNLYEHQIDKIWQEIEELHYSLCETCDDPAVIGYNADDYLSYENKVYTLRRPMTPSTNAMNARTVDVPGSNLSLPPISIPKFSGDYITWRQFFDLFCQVVHSQPLPKVHKMWYLKSNLTGEAEKLIRHLGATEDNYDTAWAMLQDRYNNIRLLSSALMQRLLGQSYNPSSVGSIRNLHDTIN